MDHSTTDRWLCVARRYAGVLDGPTCRGIVVASGDLGQVALGRIYLRTAYILPDEAAGFRGASGLLLLMIAQPEDHGRPSTMTDLSSRPMVIAALFSVLATGCGAGSGGAATPRDWR